MWPRGTHAEQLATLDDPLTALSAQWREAKARDAIADAAIIAQRYDEVLEERLRIVGPVPAARQP